MNLIDFPVFAPDMFILEFAVNDYQGQDHKVQIDYKTDAFFDGFKRLAACAEIVVYKLLADYPDSAVVFLEFQTAILNRKTAQLLHMGVAQHYQVPVISYADAMWPDFYRLLDKLEPFGYSIPKTMDISSILPYPHGCAPCDTEGIEKAFRDYGCKSVCVFMKRSGYYTEEECDAASKRYQPCYVPFFAHDAVHPSVIGHRIARDLIANVIAHTALLTCQGRMFSDHLLPTHSGWLVAGINYQSELRARSDFVLVKDTMEIFAKQDPLLSNKHTAGFQLEMDEYYRKGWIATNPSGGERVTFDIDLRPATDCYAVYLSVLKSYATVGTFTFTVEDLLKKKDTPPVTIDCLWEPQISIPVDIKLTANSLDCSGKCKVTITTNPEIPGRGGNLVKIMSLSVRKCMSASKEVTSAL